jgi:hypothetical protein
MRCVASFEERLFDKSSTGSWLESREYRLCCQQDHGNARGLRTLRSRSTNWCPSMPGMR